MHFNMKLFLYTKYMRGINMQLNEMRLLPFSLTSTWTLDMQPHSLFFWIPTKAVLHSLIVVWVFKHAHQSWLVTVWTNSTDPERLCLHWSISCVVNLACMTASHHQSSSAHLINSASLHPPHHHHHRHISLPLTSNLIRLSKPTVAMPLCCI